ncbi:MAG: hypothetical protein R3C55_06895 [Parvularculaceae bacterium]
MTATLWVLNKNTRAGHVAHGLHQRGRIALAGEKATVSDLSMKLVAFSIRASGSR